VLIAWKNTREAAVATAAAIPVLQAAAQVTVAVVEEDGASEERGEAVDEDIGRYLSRHGIRGEVRLVDGWSNVPAAILHEAGKVSADLIVLGAYGHSRLREWALGGATRDVLSQATVPVFTAR
jgi:nucleotide-binding universal stress UspA family protein